MIVVYFINLGTAALDIAKATVTHCMTGEVILLVTLPILFMHVFLVYFPCVL
jgi:hypothetical protein